jgi:hypothetical protein
MKKIASFIMCLFLSCSVHASFIEHKNYSNVLTEPFWTNNNLELDILRLNWADSLGDDPSEQKSFTDYMTFIANSPGQWRWATNEEFLFIVNWFDSDSFNTGWSADQNEGTNLFFELNGLGPKYFGTGPNGEVYQEGFDHESYSYWQFGTLIDDIFTFTWFADFGDQVNANCPDWSVLCNSGYLDTNSPHGFTALSAIEMSDLNIAPLLVRSLQTIIDPSVVNPIPEPKNILMIVICMAGLICFRRN